MDIDSLLDFENSYENFEKNEHLYKEDRNQNISILESMDVNPMDKYLKDEMVESNIKGIEQLDKKEPVTITIKDLDGIEKNIVLEQHKVEINNKQLIELKEYISSNKDRINSVEVKKGDKYHKKIPLKDFINKELNTTNYSSNPEKMGEDIILSLLKPLKVTNNYLAQNRLEKSKNEIKSPGEKFATLSINNQEYRFKEYSDNFSKITVLDKENKLYQILNDKNVKFIIPPERQLNETELNLIKNGKSLIIKNEIPFKISSEDGKVMFQTITNQEYIANINVSSKEVKVKNSNKIN